MIIQNLFIIVALTSKSYAIGKNGNMLYHLKNDLKYFKQTTHAHTIICGKNTYKTFQIKPLPHRKNIILTHNKEKIKNAYILNSKEEVLQYAINNPNETIFIVGGSNVYSQFIEHVKRLYITEIQEIKSVNADSFFPKFDINKYKLISKSKYIYENNNPKYRFLIYEIKK